MQSHIHWMRLCLELAEQALQSGNPPVGSLVIQSGQIIGRGIEAGKSKGDITCHAEIEAIRDAVKNTQLHSLSGCTLYTTHEPCLMCSYVIRHYRISTVVMGVEVPAIGGYSSAYPILSAQDIPIWPSPPGIITGVLKEECEQLTNAYKNRLKNG